MSQKIWRRIRLPLFIFIVLVLLSTVGFITRGLMVASTIEKTIKEAEGLELEGTLEQTEGAEKILFALYEKYSGEEDARAAWVWQAALQFLLWGKPLSEEAKGILNDLNSNDNEFAAAARAAAALIDGRAKDAVDLLSGGPTGPRVGMVKIIALSELGRRDEARAQITQALSQYPSYIPIVVVTAEQALAANDRLEVLRMSELLLKESPTHLFGEMLVIRLGLPEWGDSALDKEHASVLQKKLSTLMPRIASAPPKLSTLGHYLTGRISLASGRTDDAVQELEQVLEQKKDADTVAYLAEAVRMQGTAESALMVLEKHSEVNGPEIMDTRARYLLEYHRVNQAEIAIEALRKTGAIPRQVQSLTWQLAVRRGDAAAALASMPKPVGEEEKWTALEMYFLLVASGNEKGVEALAAAMDENWVACSRVFRAWHSKSLGRAVRQFDDKRSDCAQSLIPRLMRKHMAVADVLHAAEINQKESRENAIFEVDRALAVWFNQGYDAAVRILDGIAAQKPEGVPLLERLGKAYLEMNLPKKVSSLLKDSEHPELLALRIFALEMQQKKGEAKKLIEKALEAGRKSKHPALQYLALRQMLSSNNAEGVRNFVNENPIGTMGQWASEFAELGARAMWALDEKSESEKFLQAAARQTLVLGGVGEALDTFMVQVEENVERSGKYRNHALTVIRTLMDESVKDPRMSYWLAVENITNGSERVGLRMLADIPEIDPTFKPYYKRLLTMERLDESQAAVMKKMLPYFKP